MNHLLSNRKILLTIVGNIVDIAIGFGTVMLVTRTYSEEVAGKWFLFVTVFSLLNNLRDGFIQNGLIKFAQTDDENRRASVYKTSLIITAVFELGTSLLVVSLFRLFNWFELGELFLVYPCYALPYALYRWAFVLHRSQLNVRCTNLMNTAFLVALVIGSTFIFVTQSPIGSLVIVLGISSFLAAMIGIAPLNMPRLLSTPFNKTIFKEIAQYGKHGLLREVTGTLSTRIGLFITASLLSYTQTAFLGVSQRYLTLLLIPNNAFQALLYPTLVKVSQNGNPQAIKGLFETQVSKLLAAMIILAIGLSIVSHWVINAVHGDDYQPAVGLFTIAVWTLAIFTPFGSAFGSIINTIGKPHINSTIVFVNSGINIVITYLLISWIGLYGAVLGPLFTELFGFIWARKIIMKHTNISYTAIFDQVPKHYYQVFYSLKTTLAS